MIKRRYYTILNPSQASFLFCFDVRGNSGLPEIQIPPGEGMITDLCRHLGGRVLISYNLYYIIRFMVCNDWS
jgi:hypothetical protein